MHGTDLRRSHCSRISLGRLLSTCTVPRCSHKRIRGGGARLRMMAALVQSDRAVYSGYASVEYVLVRRRSCHQHHVADGCLERLSPTPSMSVIGEPTIETIVYKTVK